jgi:sulfite reductase alpha subunit-like flavoprotein
MQSPSSATENRFFVYEVAGLSQNDDTDSLDYSIRQSGSVFLTVPYSRMNQEMRRITRLGARIISIKPLSGAAAE